MRIIRLSSASIASCMQAIELHLLGPALPGLCVDISGKVCARPPCRVLHEACSPAVHPRPAVGAIPTVSHKSGLALCKKVQQTRRRTRLFFSLCTSCHVTVSSRFVPTQVAILIPFRNRHEHLPILLRHLVPVLQKQRLQFAFYLIEQVHTQRASCP